MKKPKTRLVTLYRLVAAVDASRDGMFDAYTQYVGARELDERRAEVEFPDVAGMPAVWIGIQEEDDLADWCADASVTTGLELSYTNADNHGDDVLDDARADEWLEANVSIGARRFFLMDGDWFEIGADYVRASQEAIARLFPAEPGITLPPWSLTVNRTEYEYNSYVAARSGGQYLCLDRNRSVRDPLGARSPLEICDLLGPGNELIHVKRAEGSMPLSHLFSQGYVSAQSLVAGPSRVLKRFTETAAGLPRGRILAPDFRPAKVVYAILLDNGKQLNPKTLFPFSQATLAQAARLLGSYGIGVEVIGIPHA